MGEAAREERDTSDEWIRAPKLRTAREDEGRHATWLELFFDLVFVAAVGRLAHVLGEDVSWHGVLTYGALFVPIWWAWIGATFYADRFDTDDLADRVLALAQMAAAAAMAVNVDHALDSSGQAFALSYAAFRALLVVQYLVAARHAPDARALALRWAAGFSLAAGIWAASALVEPPVRWWMWAAGLAVDLLTPITAGRLHSKVPTDTSHLPERFGLFVIIVLGESIVAVVATLDRKVWGPPAAFAALLALVVAFSLWWIYFSNLDGAAVRAARRGRKTAVYQVWLYSHLPLAAAMAAAGAGVAHALAVPRGAALPDADRWLICGSFAVCLAAIGVLDRVYAAAGSERSTGMQAAWRFGGAAFALVVGVVGSPMRPFTVMACLAALGIIQVVTDPPREREEIGDGDENRGGGDRGDDSDRDGGKNRGGDENRGDGADRGDDVDRGDDENRGDGVDRGGSENRGDGENRGDDENRGDGVDRGGGERAGSRDRERERTPP